MLPDIYWVKELSPMRLGLMARPRSGDWLEDEIAGWRRAEVGTVVSLLEPHEVRELSLSREAALCGEEGIEFLNFPIRDRGTPDSVLHATTLIDSLVERLQNGVAVAVHCRAGIGRTGLITGGILAKLGVPLPRIFPTLTLTRGSAVPDTQGQIEWVEAFHRARVYTR